MDRPKLVFVMGPTCSGKSTLLHLARNRDSESVGLVEVGKMMRAKYPPEHFQGQNNPKHTAAEAWQMCEEGVRSHAEAGKKVILVDGQPRDIPQVGSCIYQFSAVEYSRHFLLIDAALDERERRARESRSGADLETLAIPRLRNDMVAYYSVLVELLKQGEVVEIFDSTNPHRLPIDRLFSPLVDSLLA